MFDLKFIEDEINNRNLVCEDEETLARIAGAAAEIVYSDDYLAGEVMRCVDDAISLEQLPGIDDYE